MEDEAEKKTNEQQRQDSDEQYDAGPKIKLVPKKNKRKRNQGVRNLYGVNARMIMANITAHIEIRAKVIYSF